MSHLLVRNEDPVRLVGYIDGAGSLQIAHDNGNLVDHDQEIWCSHDSHTSITVEIHDFVDGSTTWVISAVHDSTSWNRESDHAWFTFSEEPSLPIDVVVTATAGTTKQRPIKVKPQPQPLGLRLQPATEVTA